MSDSEGGQQERADPRIPVDRMNTTQADGPYTHIVTGTCEKHGKTALECAHVPLEDQPDNTVLSCLVCRQEAKSQEAI